MPQIITANRLTDGVVVFLSADGAWTESVNESRVIEDDDDLRRAEALAAAAATAAVVVAPYAIAVGRGDDGIRPVRYRERIRAFGPSIHPDFAKRPAAGRAGPGARAEAPGTLPRVA